MKSKMILFIVILSNIFIICTPLQWKATFEPNTIEIHMNHVNTSRLKLTGLQPNDPQWINTEFQLVTNETDLILVDYKISINDIIGTTYEHDINVTGLFIGSTNVYVQSVQKDNTTIQSDSPLHVIVVRENRIIDHIFTGTVALLVSVLYINFGAALDMTALKSIARKPIGPTIGFVGQFLVMPLLSYGLGHLLFPDMVELQLGLFFTGVSPGGGASNIWTVILDGNLNLSIAMTTISTFAAFGMMPLWIFTLGRNIFERGNLGIPYERIAGFAFGLLIPLIIGLIIQRFLPRVAKVLVRVLKPVATLLILFIVIFAIVANLYLFQLFSWRILLAGMGLPWFGYTLSWIMAKICRQNEPDAIAIAVETGIQNTGIAIFLLRFSLEQPAADLTTVIPVSVAIMTPFPLMLLYSIRESRKRYSQKRKSALLSNASSDQEVRPVVAPIT